MPNYAPWCPIYYSIISPSIFASTTIKATMETTETLDRRDEKAAIPGNEDLLNRFFNRVQNDPRIGFSHIALFTAMVQMSQDNFSISFYGKELRQLAKIGSSRTYFKLLKDLYECRYIRYIKGANRWQRSSVLFLI